MTRPTSSLQRSEWVFFITILATIAILFTFAKASSSNGLERLRKWERVEPIPEVWIQITGHVKHPGSWKLLPGANLGGILRKAVPKPFADLSKIDPLFVPNEDMSIEIFPAKTIRVRVCGCVKENIELEVEPGFRISDLKGKIELASDADPKFLRKRRMLQNEEVIKIPSHPKS